MKKLARCMALLIVMSCFLTTSGWGYSFSEEYVAAKSGNDALTSLANLQKDLSGGVWFTATHMEFLAEPATFSSVEDAIWWTTYHQLPLASRSPLGKKKTVEGYQFITENYKLVAWVDKITPIPEPTTIALMGLGLTGIFTVSSKKKK